MRGRDRVDRSTPTGFNVQFGLPDEPPARPDGGLSALRYLVGLLASDPVNPPLAVGEIVSTGTLTKAMPVVSGETWTAAPAGIALDAIQLRFG
jgi:2-keto-4-pentenoate hydratase